MSAREAYIAGRSGGSRPPTKQTRGSDPSETQRNTQQQDREQKSFDAGQQERKREQTIKEKGIQGLSQRNQEQAKIIAEKTGKDPYNTLTNKEKETLPSFEEKKRFTIQDTFDFFSKFSPMVGIGKGIGVLIDSLIKNPKAKQFTNPNDLAIIRSLFTDEEGEVDTNKLDDYYDQYKTTIDEGMGIGAFKDVDGTGLSEAAKQGLTFEDIIMGASPKGVKGMESQLRLDPVSYYTEQGIPQTTDGLGRMAANLTFDDIAKSGLSGAERRRLGYELQQAREAGRDRDGSGGQSGIMTAAPVVPPVVPDPVIPVDPIPAPGTTPPNTTPKYPGSVVNNYTNMGIPNIYGNQQIPTYGYANFNQTGQPVGLQNYLDNLRKRFGIG